MSRLIYADNAATTQMDIAAFETIKPFLTNEYGNASQPYAFARKPKKALQDAREIWRRVFQNVAHATIEYGLKMYIRIGYLPFARVSPK